MTITLDRPLHCFRSSDNDSSVAEDSVRISGSLEKEEPALLLEESYQDRFSAEDSIDDWTVSTTSSSDEYDVSRGCSSSSSSLRKAVTFSEELVSQVWTRPRTPTEDVRKLFYSSEDTQRFRQEYRFERKRSEDIGSKNHSSSSMPSKTHRIQRVVVLHKDIQQTFVEPEDTDPSGWTHHDPHENLTTEEMDDPTHHKKVTSTCYASHDFFDNPSFWSGQITWY